MLLYAVFEFSSERHNSLVSLKDFMNFLLAQYSLLPKSEVIGVNEAVPFAIQTHEVVKTFF